MGLSWKNELIYINNFKEVKEDEVLHLGACCFIIIAIFTLKKSRSLDLKLLLCEIILYTHTEMQGAKWLS